jgi:hypothetical protein
VVSWTCGLVASQSEDYPIIHFNNIIMSAIKFKVKIGEKTYELEGGDADETVSSLKERALPLVNVPVSEQKWIFQGRILTDVMKFSETNIKDGSCVIIMKIAGAKPASAPTVPAPASSPSVAPRSAQSPALQAQQGLPPQQPVQQAVSSMFVPRIPPGGALFDRAMLLLLGNDEDTVSNAVSTLLKIVSNIIQTPLEEKFRKVNNNNAAFKKKVGGVLGGPQCMMALGFTLIGDEWILEPHSDVWDNLIICKNKAERFMQRLQTGQAQSSPKAAPTAPIPPASVSTTNSSSATSANGAAASAPSGADLMAFQQLLQMMAMQQGVAPSPAVPLSSASSSASAAAPVPVSAAVQPQGAPRGSDNNSAPDGSSDSRNDNHGKS